MKKAIATRNGESSEIEMTAMEVSEFESTRKNIEKKKKSQYYKTQRSMNYPPIGDQLDAILKAFHRLSGGDRGFELPTELNNIIGRWLDVKKQFPKPTESTDKGL